MPAPKYNSTIRELIEKMRGTSGSGNREFDIAKAILDVKLQEAHTRATWILVFATIGLVVATIGLIIVTWIR